MTGFKLVQDTQKVVYYQKRRTGPPAAVEGDEGENASPGPREAKKTEQR